MLPIVDENDTSRTIMDISQHIIFSKIYNLNYHMTLLTHSGGISKGLHILLCIYGLFTMGRKWN